MAKARSTTRKRASPPSTEEESAQYEELAPLRESAQPQEESFPSLLLKKVPLFQGVAAKHKGALGAVVERRTLSPKEMLVAEDAPGDMMFFLLEGAVKITVRKGRSVVLLGLCGPGEILGELAAIDGNSRSATVVAQTPCLVGALSAEQFWTHLWPISPIPRNMSYLLVKRVRKLTAKVQAMATLDVKARLAYQMVSLAREHSFLVGDGGDVIPFALTQTELSQMIGTSRVQVNQQLSTWSDEGILSIDRRSILIHRLEDLRLMYPASLDAVAPPAERSYSSGVLGRDAASLLIALDAEGTVQIGAE